MLGNFQNAQLRIEVEASRAVIHDSLLRPQHLRQWLFPQRLPDGLPEQLHQGLIFNSSIGTVNIQHQVDIVEPNALRLLLSGSIDGYHEWYWGDGWIQSRLEGISLLPLNLSHTLSLLRLRQFLAAQK